MLRVLIIEDEESAAKRLQKLVAEALPDSTVEANLSNITAAVEWFRSNPQPDLAFFDIHLADGSSFEIFRQVKVECPVIFTTAYNQYALDAFKVNSIDYLLKPVKKEELQQAIEKFRKLQSKAQAPIDIQKLLSSIQPGPAYKERFVIRYGEHMRTIQVADIAYFYTENRISFAVLKSTA